MWQRGQNIHKKQSKQPNESFNSYNKKYQQNKNIDDKQSNIQNDNKPPSKKQSKQYHKDQRKYNSNRSSQQSKPKDFVNPIYKNESDKPKPEQPTEFLKKMREIADIHPDNIPNANENYYFLRKRKGLNKIEYSDDGINYVPYIGQPFPEEKDNITINHREFLHRLHHYVDEDDPYYMSDSIDYELSDESEDDEEPYFSDDDYY